MQRNKHRNRIAFLYCSSVRGPFEVLEANFIGEDLPSSASACFTELLIFTANRLLNDVTEVEEILGVHLERNVQVPKTQNYV